MSIRSLESFFNPRRIAVVGASEDPNSLGYTVFKNLIGKGFKGAVYPVNSKLEAVQGVEAYKSITDIPKEIDLAILANLSREMPTTLEECGQKEVKGVIIYVPDYRERLEDPGQFENQIRQISRTYDFRVLGPNSIGFIRPGKMLNTSLFPEMPPGGNIAFISQSATMSNVLLDRAVSKNVGLSYFISLGVRLDIDTTDVIDFLAADPATRAIILYVDEIRKGRKFMTSVRSFASSKPLVIVKAGKFDGMTDAEVYSSGLPTGEDRIYDAAIKRAGAVRVDEILDLFYLAETLSKQVRPQGRRLCIITNAGGPGLIAVDSLLKLGGSLARLNEETVAVLKSELPHLKRTGNPFDLLSTASPQEYSVAVSHCMKDPGVDGVLVIQTPSFGARPLDTAKAVISTVKAYPYKPVFTSWMGEDLVVASRNLLIDSGIPTFVTSEQAVKSFIYMYRYDSNLKILSETPQALLKGFNPDREMVEMILRNAAGGQRLVLCVSGAKEVLNAYGIPVIPTEPAHTEDEAVDAARHVGFPVVLKVESSAMVGKAERGGIVLNVRDENAVRSAYRNLEVFIATLNDPTAHVLVQPMIIRHGFELMIGVKKNPTFGSVIYFGTGGELLDALGDYSVGLPPLNQALARHMMAETRIFNYLSTQEAYRDTLRLLEEVLARFSQLVVDFPLIKEIKIDPFFVTEHEGFVFNASIVLDEQVLSGYETSKGDLCPPHLSICPYPDVFTREAQLKDGTPVTIRAIRAEDEPLIERFMNSLSEDSINQRFCQQLIDMPHERLVRYCQVDYDRELAFVAVVRDDSKGEQLIGDVRFIKGADPENAEAAILVGDQWQGKGVGSMLMDYCIKTAKETGVKALWMEILNQNSRMQALAKRFGFKRAYADEYMVKVVLEI